MTLTTRKAPWDRKSVVSDDKDEQRDFFKGQTKYLRKTQEETVQAVNQAQTTFLGEHNADGSHKNPLAAALLVDGTAGRVLRISSLKIEDGTAANSIKCTMESFFNGDAISAEDNLTKGGSTTSFELDATGYELTIKASALSGAAVGVFAVVYRTNWAGTSLVCYGIQDGGSIKIRVFAAVAGSAFDLSAITAAQNVFVQILYLTEA